MDKTNISCNGSCSGPISYGRIQYQGPYFAICIISIVLVGKDYTKVIGYMS